MKIVWRLANLRSRAMAATAASGPGARSWKRMNCLRVVDSSVAMSFSPPSCYGRTVGASRPPDGQPLGAFNRGVLEDQGHHAVLDDLPAEDLDQVLLAHLREERLWILSLALGHLG